MPFMRAENILRNGLTGKWSHAKLLPAGARFGCRIDFDAGRAGGGREFFDMGE